ncbi:MAG: family 16 glycosylhydrolase, partial [Anaerolineae bacterium]|nr:family 16 glycosylhydrolase [Anaerolineae bacterium]
MNTKKIIQSVAAIAILALVFVKIPVQPVLAQEFGDTTATEFAVNTSNTCYIGEADDGELLLVPTVGEEFSGPGLPVGWSSIPWTSGGGATVSGGQLSVDGALFATDSYYGPGRTLEFVATFGADTYQHIGFGQDFEVAGTETWAIFGTLNSTTSLYARTNNLGDMNDFQIPIPLSGSWIGSAHNYRINWGVSSIEFYIDGSLVHSQPVTISTDMRPAISDYNLPAPSIDVDWIRMSPYSSSCVFDSRSINAGASTTWADLDWTGSVPLNTTADFYTRVSDDINGPWSDWALVDGAGNLTGIVDGQYIQYRIELASTDDSVTPIIEDVTLTSADKVWNGSASSDWGTAANWTPSGVPSTLDDVLIPAPGPGNWPQISGAAESDGLIVQDGAELAIQSSGSLNAAGKVKNHGVLIQTIA